MNSESNDIRQSREIDLIDMFWYWLSHFKSLIVFLLIGIGVGLILFFMAAKAKPSVASDSSVNSSNTEIDVESNMTKSNYAGASFEKPYPYKEGVDWNKRLSDSQRARVEYVAGLYKNLNDLADRYNNSSNAALEEQSEALYYITSSLTNVDNLVKGMSEDQRKYFYELVGLNTVSDYYGDTVVIVESKNTTTNSTDKTQSTASNNSGGKKKLIICIIAALLLHMIVFALIYIFDKKLKYTENPASMLGINDFSRVIDWDAIRKKDALTRAITKARLKGEREISYEEALQVNVNSIIDIASKNNLSELLVISQGLESEGERIKQLLEEDSEIKVSVVDNVTHSALGAKTASETGGCIILSKVGKTVLYDILEEGAAIRSRGIDLLGVIVYV